MTEHHPPPLAALKGVRPAAPDWFTAALAMPLERGRFEHAGAAIELLAWGPRGAPGLLLVHGNGAHADWWGFIAPLLADRYRVAALSLSGMGGSDHRAAYSNALWAEELLAAARQAGLFDAAVQPLFVAHSFGGFALTLGAARYGEQLAGAVIVDMPLRPPAQHAERQRRRAEVGFKPSRVYRSLEDALARFRFLPEQRCEHLFIADHIARHSLRPARDEQGQPGYSWRFDPFLFKHFEFGRPQQELPLARCPLTLVRGGRSGLVTPDFLAHAQRLAPPGTRTIEVPDADHHVMVDQPLAFAALLAELRAAAR